MMPNTIAPKTYGLSSRDRLIKISENHLALVINRKSRIIMADGRRILEKINNIRKLAPGVNISLQTNAPVCSKTVVLLKESDVEIIDFTLRKSP